MSLSAATGGALMKEVLEYPHRQQNDYFLKTTKYERVVVPLEFYGNYDITRRFSAGLFGGLYLHPAFPVTGMNLGIQLAYMER